MFLFFSNMVVLCDQPFPPSTSYEPWFERFPYPLSDFQKHAIRAIVDGDHALVTAHTGSGKTLPAEFAIQYWKEQGKKVVYTSPIKALSNQKYYEFTRKYPDITFGLFTGDIKTNPDADVLIMTTEILMNSLFKYKENDPVSSLDFQLDIQRDLACVIFDEVHYINDVERGQVWEKTILMLPPFVQMVMLSATIDNPVGFAEWCETGRSGGQLTKQVYLASTNKRVVPLTHYGFLTVTESLFKGLKDKVLEKYVRDHTNGLIMLQNAGGAFQEPSFHTIKKLTTLFETKQVYMKRQHVLNSLSLYLRDHEMLPAIAFVFSRKQVELCAKEITVSLLADDSKVGYTVRRECEQIVRKLPNFQEYLELPEYNQLIGLLEKGIGIHHSGMVPVLREIVELMISKKYIQLLFATESFAIGLDCPIKTAVFTGLSKFDGTNHRALLPHEYTQMAGRAGRRGLDTIGHVVHCNNLFPLPTLGEYRTVLCGKPQELVSKFHLSYSLILNLMKHGQDRDFHLFSEKSMVKSEMDSMMRSRQIYLSELNASIEKKEALARQMRTPYETGLRYLELEQWSKTTVNKKRKEVDKEIRSLEEEYRTIKQDVVPLREIAQLQAEYKEELYAHSYTATFLENQTENLCTVLLEEGFIQKTTDEETGTTSYRLLEWGTMASSIAEVHPIIMTNFIKTSHSFASFSLRQLIGFLSCFTDIKVAQDERAHCPKSEDAFLQEQIKALAKEYDRFARLEQDRDLRTGLHYDDVLNYDIVDATMQWVDCSDETECKQLIQQLTYEKGISIGDFNKAMMKITTIAKELMAISEQMGQTEFLYTLSKVEGMVLKYVATAQSLYV